MKGITIGFLSLAFAALPGAAMAAPAITLFGDNPFSIQQGVSYVEPGYSAFDSLDGNITSSVVVSGSVGQQVGSYSLGYGVTNSLGDFASQSRIVNVNGGGSINGCLLNGTCPCPMSAETNPVGWKACVLRTYPKDADGSTRLCRLKELQPGEHIQCAAKQGGFLNVLFYPSGSSVELW